MKKFLFTLLTLFMASSAFAEGGNYFYMDNFTVVKTKLGEVTVKANVKGHFDNYVSAWQCDLGYVNENGEEVMNALPEGMTKVTSVAGDDMKNLPYVGEDGSEAEYSPNIKKGMSGTRLIVAADEGNYSPDGELYGCVKWAPGNYDKMMVLTFTCSKDFTGAKLILKTLPSCGADTRPEISENLAPTVWATSPVCIVDVKYIAPEPVFTWNETTYTMDAAVPEGYNADDYVIVMYANGVEVEFPYTVEQTTDEQTIVFTAYTQHADDETYDSNDATYGKTTTMTVTVPAKEQLKDLNGTIKLGDVTDDGKVTVTYTPGEGDPENVELAVVVKDKDGKVVENAYADGVITLPDYGEYTVTVTASATGYNDKTFDAEPVTWNKKAVGAPVINYETYDTEVVVIITWPAETDGEHVYTGQYTYPRTNEDQSFDVEAYVKEGTKWKESAHATKTIPVPKKEVIAKPTITFSGEETTTMTVTVSCETPGVTLYVNGAAVEGNPYSYTVTRDDVYTAGTVEVTAVAKKGELESETAEESKAWVVKDKPMAPEATKTENVTDTQVTVNFTPAEGTDTEVSVKVGDETVTLPYVIDRPAYGKEPITVTFVVTVTGDNYTTNTYNVVVTVQPQEPTYASKPKITFTPDNGGVTVKIEDYTEYTIKVNGTQVDPTRNEHSYYVEKGDVDKEIVVYAKNAPENMIAADTTATYLLAAKKVYEVPDPEINVTNDAATQTTIITITVPENAPEGTVLDYTLTAEEGVDYTVEEVDGKVIITVVNGDETAFVTVTATTTLTEVPAGYDEVKKGEAEKTVEIPQYQKTAMPTIDVSFGGEDGAHYANVTFVNNDNNAAVIEYSLNGGETWLTYKPGVPVVIRNYGDNTVLARATATGKATSDTAERTFTLNDDATSVNELVNGKTVAGVRYFNMAGQEMQEANGITIVVTTYTDGTTSAVKVIK